MSRKDATDDYLASNTYNAAVHAGYISWYESMGYSHDESVAGIVLQKDFIETTVDQLTEVYGSFDNVVEYGLGLSDSEVEQLRDAYVASRG